MTSLSSIVHTLPPLREVIAAHELGARKQLGQHFLLDLNLTRRIARAAGDLTDGTTIEIGPGPGGLTRALLIEGASRVIAIETDPRAVAAIRELVEVCDGRLEILEADALGIDIGRLGTVPRRIVANLPYNIATPLLIQWLRAAAELQSMTLMFQKEVAERLAAAPRTKAYGRLSVLAQYVCDVELLFDISPQAFVPPPKVTSTVVRLVPRTPAAAIPLPALEQLTAAAFSQRRKMLRVGLRRIFPDPEAVLEAAGVAPTARAEELDVAAFVRLARASESRIRPQQSRLEK